MVRDLNNSFMVPLTGVFPVGRLGPTGDVAKINCATCHQGAYKPFYGASEVQSYPELKGPAPERQASLPQPGLRQAAVAGESDGGDGVAPFALSEDSRSAIADQIAAVSGPRMSLEPQPASSIRQASAGGNAERGGEEVHP